jgi:LemA protein
MRRRSGGAEARCYHEAVLGLWIVLGLLLLGVVYAIAAFNRLVRTRNSVENAWSQIDVQLRRRYDLIPNLVEAVKGYAAHEREVFEEVTRARTLGMEASSVESQANAENELNRGLRQLLAVAEAYPELKANQNFLALQEELTATENKISFARQHYNDEVRLNNTAVETIPTSLVAPLAHVGKRDYFEVDPTDPARNPVQVQF